MKRFLILEKVPFFLLFVPVFFLIHLVAEFYPLFTIQHLNSKYAAAYLLIGLVIFAIAIRFWYRPFVVFLFLCELAYFYFGPLKSFLDTHLTWFGRYTILLPLLLLVIIIIPCWLYKRKTDTSRFFLFSNLLLLIFILFDLFEIGFYRQEISPTNHNVTTNESQRTTVSSLPDIFFVIFDGYSGSATLRNYFHFDNSALDSFFRENRFYLANNSNSNYNSTPFSIGSIFNMDYHARSGDAKIDYQEFCKAVQGIQKSTVPAFLQNKGYYLINNSGFNIQGGGKPRTGIAYLNDPKKLIQYKTLGYRLIEDIGYHFSLPDWLYYFYNESDAEGNERRGRYIREVKEVYQKLVQTANLQYQQPIFSYTHFLLPHDPYYFDSLGTVQPEHEWLTDIPAEKDRKYIAQLKFTNSWIREIVTHLLKTAKKPRVIIIQSDHGYRSFSGQNTHALEFNNLNAIYFPDHEYQGLYDSISSVNTFRVVFSKYFNENLPLLNDSTVYLRH